MHPGEPFWVTGELWNDVEPMHGVPVFFLLEVYGSFWYWPGWELERVDYELRDVPVGMTEISVIERFTWPDTGDEAMDNLWFYGAMLNPEMTEILGEYDAVRWGYGP